MQLSSRFTIAVHLLLLLETEKKENVTSHYLASSVGVNPVVIRQVLAQLRASGIIQTQQGKAGAKLTIPLASLTLYDVYRAVDVVETNGSLFRFHENPNPNCQVGSQIHAVLDERLWAAQAALEKELKQTTLASLMKKHSSKL